jgi:hypothetical protein
LLFTRRYNGNIIIQDNISAISMLQNFTASVFFINLFVICVCICVYVCRDIFMYVSPYIYKDLCGDGGTAPRIHNVGTRYMCSKLHALRALTLEKCPKLPLNNRLGVFRAN